MAYLRAGFLIGCLGVLWVLTGCGGGSSPAPTGQVEGFIYAAAQQAFTVARAAGDTPVAGAQVAVQGTALSTLTNDTGYFSLTGVPAGARTLVITKQGYEKLMLPVTVQANTTINVAENPMTPASREWTIMVFLNADNDLETFGIQDVNEMESVPDSDRVTVAVQMDRIAGYDTSNGNWSGARRFKIQHDDDLNTITSPVLEELGEVDMGRPETLRDFIAWAKDRYPAQHYMLVLWNHGSGWRARTLTATTTPTARAISYDDTSGTRINITELPGAVAMSPSLDIIAYDACLMQMLEIAYELRNSCSYLVGSEGDTPSAGYAYDTWLNPLAADPAMSPRDLGITMARETLTYYGQESDISHSVLDTSKIGAVTAAVNAFADTLIANVSAQAALCASARDNAEAFNYSSYFAYKDLYDYAARVQAGTTVGTVSAAAGAVMTAVQNAVVANYVGTYHPNAHGITINIPVPLAYPREAASYLPLIFAQQTHWDEWLATQVQ